MFNKNGVSCHPLVAPLLLVFDLGDSLLVLVNPDLFWTGSLSVEPPIVSGFAFLFCVLDDEGGLFRESSLEKTK